ncbi:hypothetical protein SNE40_022798 [Patella caerulea]|uniref:Uncharacterized protein n=1 Tax=Patella caerulea TaxID=87958 RepID=A0AAN8G642_PATCE
MIGFSYHGQLCRLLLAVMHFNENTNREQFINQNGEAGWRIVFPKFKKGDYSLKKMLVMPTYAYADTLTTKVIELATDRSMLETQMSDVLPVAPPTLCQEFYRPYKKTALSELKSRFSFGTDHGNPEDNKNNFN